MKKSFACFLSIALLLCLIAPLKVNAASTTKVTEHVTMVGEAVNSTLWDGVSVERMHIKSERAGSYSASDAGLVYDWDSVSVIASNNPAIKIASWGMTTTSGYKQGTTAAIAKDYEKIPVDKGINILDLLINMKAASSKREAREFVAGNAVSINGEKVTDLEYTISDKDFLDKTYIILRRGKKNYYIGKRG